MISDRKYLENFNDTFQEIVPGCELHPNNSGGITAQWHIRIDTDIRVFASVDTAKDMARTLAEQMRARAIRELGLFTVLEGYHQDAMELERTNRALQSTVIFRNNQIDRMRDEIEDLKSRIRRLVEDADDV